MELMQVVVPMLLMLHAAVLACWLPWWLVRFSWFRCLENWVWYRRWHPCRHPVHLFRLYGPSMPANPEAEVWECACEACGMVFLRDTRAHWEAATQRVSWWHRWRHALRFGGR